MAWITSLNNIFFVDHENITFTIPYMLTEHRFPYIFPVKFVASELTIIHAAHKIVCASYCFILRAFISTGFLNNDDIAKLMANPSPIPEQKQ